MIKIGQPDSENLIVLKTNDGESIYQSSKTWEEINLTPEFLEIIELKNWISPTLIQSVALPLIISGENIVAQSVNGSGKTGSFVIGTLCRISKENPNLQALCVCHTRELTNQNYLIFNDFGKKLGFTIGKCEKGRPTPDCQILCLTFGALKRFSKIFETLSTIKVVIYDECDFLFNNEEAKNVIFFVQRYMRNTQKVLFSATIEKNVWDIVEEHIENPKIIRIEKREDLNLERVDQFSIRCDKNMKFECVLKILMSIDLRCCIIFINTKIYLKNLEEFLEKAGYKVSIIASDLVSDIERDIIIEKVRNGQVKILLTTDVLSRGVDFRLVNVVINYDLPMLYSNAQRKKPDPITYLHRIGRTGRYGRRGLAVNLVSDMESQHACNEIEDFFNKKIKLIDVEKLADEVEKVNVDYDI